MNIITLYEQLASAVGTETGASDSLLHVHAGMVVLFLARVITRRSLATWLPATIVLAAALANEVLDYINHGQLLMPDSAYDVINTIFWPFVLMIGLRIRRARVVETDKAAPNKS